MSRIKSLAMSYDDSLPIPGAWNSLWESPVATTQGREDDLTTAVQAMQGHIVPVPVAQIATTQHRSGSLQEGYLGPPRHEVPLPPNLASSPCATPVLKTQATSLQTRNEDYNPDPTASSRYALFADASNTERHSNIANGNKPPIVIAVFGQTGTGKTSFVKAVTGEDLKIGHSLTSCERHHLKPLITEREANLRP